MGNLYNYNDVVVGRMNQLQQQILIHSILYYRLGCSIWSDDRWNSTAKELQGMAEKNPEAWKQTILYEDFKGFSWVSGYDLPLYHEEYTAKALWLMKEAEKKGELL